MYRLIIICGLLVLALAGCGEVGTPPTAAVRTATPAPTVVPTTPREPTSPLPTAPAVALPFDPQRALGISRDSLLDVLEPEPYLIAFEEEIMSGGVPEMSGTGIGDIAIDLIGPAENLYEMQVGATVGRDNQADSQFVELMIALLDLGVPSIEDPQAWVDTHIQQALQQGSVEVKVADRTISIIAAEELGYVNLSIARTRL